MKLYIFLMCVFFLSTNAVAMDVPTGTANCHCFKDRSYNPQKKYAADGYLLTTTFNSFIAANFDISKSQIVMMKMKGGVDSDDLLIALYVARAGRVDFNTLLAIRDNGGSWKHIIKSDSLAAAEKKDRVLQEILAADEVKEATAERVTDQLLQEYFSISQHEIKILRQHKLSGRELTLVLNLERYEKGKKSAADIVSLYQRQMSWAEIAHSFELTPKETGRLLLPDSPELSM